MSVNLNSFNFEKNDRRERGNLEIPAGWIKLDRETALEAFLPVTGTILAALAVLFLWNGLFGYTPRHSSRFVPPDPRLVPPGLILLVASAVFFAARYFTDNYYLLDPERGRLFYHFKFLWFRWVRLLLERRDIAAATTEGRIQTAGPQRGKWGYRVLLIAAVGRKVPLSDWRWEQQGLEECNAQAADLARTLGCQCQPAPAGGQVRIRAKDGTTSVSFAPLRWGLTRGDRVFYCVVAPLLFILIVGGLLLLKYPALL